MTNQTHPEFPISCGDFKCCTGNAGENVMRECKRMECAGKAIHPAGYHRYDDAVQNTSEMRGIEKLFERFFDEVCNSILDYGDMPYPMEYDSDSDAIADFRDWYAMQVIRKLAKGI